MSTPNEALQRFREGAESMFRQWTALGLAVQHGWGGPSSGEKAQQLVAEVLELFDGRKKIYKDDVSMLVEDFVDSEFNMVCEDGSPDEIGEILVTMYNQCGEGNFSLVQSTVAREASMQNMISRSSGLEDGGDAVDDTDQGNSSQDMNTIVEEEAASREPQIDEDGFETVVRGKRTRSNKRYG